MSGTIVPTDRVIDLTQVLYHEAHLLDIGDYEGWLALLDPEVVYTAPIPSDELRHGDSTAVPGSELRLRYFNDNLGLLQVRVAKIRTGLPQTEQPASRCVRLISNVAVLAETAPGEHPVRSAFVLYRHRRQRQVEILAGHRDDLWRRTEDGWRLAHREIRFAANVLPTKSLSLIY